MLPKFSSDNAPTPSTSNSRLKSTEISLVNNESLCRFFHVRSGGNDVIAWTSNRKIGVATAVEPKVGKGGIAMGVHCFPVQRVNGRYRRARLVGERGGRSTNVDKDVPLSSGLRHRNQHPPRETLNHFYCIELSLLPAERTSNRTPSPCPPAVPFIVPPFTY